MPARRQARSHWQFNSFMPRYGRQAVCDCGERRVSSGSEDNAGCNRALRSNHQYPRIYHYAKFAIRRTLNMRTDPQDNELHDSLSDRRKVKRGD
jgi:hypothetical protein